jgi:hypothetical protein
VQDVLQDQIPATPTPYVQHAPPSPSPVETDSLASERGVDYSRLRDLLKVGNWRDADTETWHRMLKPLIAKKTTIFPTKENVTISTLLD